MTVRVNYIPAVHTLDETAAHLGMSRDVVRRIESSALRKLRCNPAVINLKDMLKQVVSPTAEHYVRLRENSVFEV